MSLETDDVKKVARLARIAIEPAETPAIIASLNRVIELIDRMRETSTDGVEPLAHPLEDALSGGQRLRPDVVTETDARDAQLALAPAAQSGLYLVPRVIE